MATLANFGRFTLPLICLISVLASSASSCLGQLYVYESFDYSANTNLAGQGGGIGFSSSWTTNNGSGPELEIRAASINFNNLVTAGGSIGRANRTNITTSARTLDSGVVSSLTNDGTTVWGSFLYRDGNGDGFNADSSLSLASTSAAVANSHLLSGSGEGIGLAIGEREVFTEAIVYDGASAPTFSDSTLTDADVLDNTSLFVFSIEWNAGADDVLTFYRVTDPSSDTLPAPFSTATFNFTAAEQASLDTLNIVETQTGEFDEIRLGATLADVLPTMDVPPPAEPPISDGPNIIYIITDDMGYSDIGCYGGEIETPHVDSLAAEGLRFRQFYNCSKCETTRTSLMTGLYHGRGDGRGNNTRGGATLAEAVKTVGYRTYAVGKWHLGTGSLIPIRQGFDRFYGFYNGGTDYFAVGINDQIKRDTAEAGNYLSAYPDSSFNTQDGNASHQVNFAEDFYQTDALGDNAVTFIQDAVNNHSERPFFLYLAFNAPHTPLQAPVPLIDKYRNGGFYDAGWDQLRQEKWERQLASGLVDSHWTLPELRDDIPKWDSLTAAEQEAEIHRRSVYAAMMDSLDQNVGKVLQQLEDSGIADDTLVIFAGDNGAQAFNTGNRNFDPSDPRSRWAMGPSWAALSNAPFRYYKQSQHQGGNCTPFIARWPGTIEPNTMTDQPGHVIDVMATLVDITGADYDSLLKDDGDPVPPMDGKSLLPILEGGTRPAPDFWGFEFSQSEFAVLRGEWKLTSFSSSPWRLYNLTDDRTETNNLRWEHPEIAAELAALYDQWAIDTYGNTTRTYAQRNTRDQLSQELRYLRVLGGGLLSNPGVDIALNNIGSGANAAMNDHWEFYQTDTSASGMSGTNDSVTFASKTLSGDGEVIAMVESMSDLATNGNAGVMFRSSDAADSALIMVGVDASGRLVQSVRTATGQAVTTTTFNDAMVQLPAFFKVTRRGNTFTPCYSDNLASWTALDDVTLNLSSDVLAGLSAASGSNNTRARITFREWTNVEFAAICGGFPAGDANRDNAVNFLDISALISILSSGEYTCEADVNQDQSVDFLDIGPFIELLSSN